ncbi:MAG: transketolase [Candidatus Yanofskybacteria bacterium CG10_big_fil_rev_8_21_14_0_10_36_16]|uniref:Transketolase n=1 Tax=Candidatus Yanofskybacteria bacterium CG10_big_fil_rev_8_21_14_0_10_36_16 TaxID=1975096 RepID=A0A2J0Q7H1_9BACT|nr:MAG: transketolase [Candidatus Yanofskybacteria bacterium CG10_big_fil_rev_8_21_14_0_10_36_16]
MINEKMHLVDNLTDKDKLEMAPTRDGYGKGLIEAGEKDKNVVVLCADLAESTRTHWFKEKFPERYIEMGVAEQNMATVAAGLALAGKIPFISSYAAFSPGRNNEQLRTTAALNNVPVKIGGAHAGISVGPDGATHQALEDAGLMRMIPRMTVLVPCDAVEAKKATLAAAKLPGPVYIRFARDNSPVFTTEDTPFEVGKAQVFREGKDATIVAASMLVYDALVAAEELSKEGLDVGVVNSPSLKPFDVETVVGEAKKSGAVVSVEEHQVIGGLGSAVAETLAQHYPVPQEFIGVKDRFGESGNADELMKEFGLDVPAIKEAVKKVVSRKK